MRVAEIPSRTARIPSRARGRAPVTRRGSAGPMPRVTRRVAGTIRRIVATSGALVVIGSVALTVGAGLIGAAYLIGHVVGWTHAAYFAAGGLVQIVGARITGWNRTRHLREVLHWFDRHDVARRFVDLPSPEDRARQGLP